MNAGIRGRRRTAAVIATAGVLALSVLNAPAAQAKDTGIVLSDLVINNGKPIVIGTSRVVEPPTRFNITLPAGYSTDNPSRYDAHPFLYRGNITHAADSGDNYLGPGGYICYELDAHRARCEGAMYIDPAARDEIDSNDDATTWKIGVSLRLYPAGDGPVVAQEYETRPGSVSLRRAAKLAVADATPEPVAKGKKLTLKGKLTRANWTTFRNGPYAASTVSLQFRANNATTFKTLKKVTTNSAGALRTTVTASADGFFRWVYYGNSTTGTATSAQDYIDVR
ncbi:hypothetical protein PV396_20845 [Streptomyces sp. ME02-8801-2C]|uniref:hypothetical protein n=1 Tax=Streptomyces sp. ME02-8801-2C TaxID=3028680 RepID=UPI0029BC49F4|nr:hypothetical protein [Streptomyces sp. ME02-8801-2C]MDX3454361.1 hypothetical protein [Streptomyces sp. ME02-8801-2C]